MAWHLDEKDRAYGSVCPLGVSLTLKKGIHFSESSGHDKGFRRQLLVHEPEIQPLVPLTLPALMIMLIRLSLFKRHGLPYPLFAAIEILEILLLEDESDEREGANGDEDFVAAVVVRRIVCTVDFWMEGLTRGCGSEKTLPDIAYMTGEEMGNCLRSGEAE